MMLTFPFYLTALFTQIYSLSGTNSSIAITSGETYIQLEWPVTNTSATYSVLYGIEGNVSDVRVDSVAPALDDDTEMTHRIDNLDPGQLYNLELQKDGATIFLTSTGTKPLPVSTIVPHDITTTSINITWLPSDNSRQDRYQVFYTETTNLTAFLGPNVTETWYQLGGLVPGHYYQVSVRAYSNGEASNQSAVVTVNTAPLPPESVSVAAIDTRQLNITWLASVNSQQESYMISYTYNNSAGNEVEVNTTCDPPTRASCVVMMPGAPGQVYDVRVHAVLGDVASDAAMQVHSTKPLPVTGVREIFSNDSAFHLAWTPPTNTSHYRQFLVEVSSDYGNMQGTIVGDKSEMIVTDLHAGSRYNVTVTVSTGYEVSEPVYEVIYTYPMQVTSLYNNAMSDTTNTSVVVHWTVNNATLYNNFIVDIEPPPDSLTLPIELGADTLTFTFSDLSPGHAYTVSVRTELQGKQSDLVTQIFHTRPNIPVDIAMTVVSSSEIFVEWRRPEGKLDAYQLTLTSSDLLMAPNVVSLTGTNHTFYGLEAGTKYRIMLVSQSGGVASDEVTQSLTTNQRDPAAVPSLEVTMVTTDSATVAWAEPSSATFDEYELSIDPPDVASPVTVSREESNLTYTFSPLAPGRVYAISVATVIGGVHSEKLTQTLVTRPLPVVTVEVAPMTTTRLAVTWTVNSTSRQHHFIVSYQELPMGAVRELAQVAYVEGVTSYGADIEQLLPGGTYSVSVQVWQEVAGQQASAESVNITGTTKPSPVAQLAASEGPAGVSVDWIATGESIQDHYIVRHRPGLRDPDSPWYENSTLSTDLTLTGLFAGEKYEIEVYAVSHDIRSDVQIIDFVTVPLPPLTAEVITEQTRADRLTLQWHYNSSLTHVQHWLLSYFDVDAVSQQLQVPAPPGGGLVEKVVKDMTAGYRYIISVQSVVMERHSSTVVLHATTMPVINSELSEVSSTNTTFTLGYTLEEKDHFDSITFHLAATNTTITREKGDADRTITFTGLASGTPYTVEVHTSSGGIQSDRKTVTIYTAPNAPVVDPLPASHNITLTISRPSGGVASYRVICTSPDGDKVKDTSVPANVAMETVVVDGLQPHTMYMCVVTAIISTKSNTVTMDIMTLQAAPSAVQNLVAEETGRLEVTLTWEPPLLPNGIITVYVINYVAMKRDVQVQGGANVTYPATSHVFTDLQAGSSYTFDVRARTVALGDKSQYSITTATYAPPYRDGITELAATPRQADPTLVPVLPHRLTFNFTNVFSMRYGDIVAYTVIMARDVGAAVLLKPALPGWKATRDDPTIMAYQVISNCSDFFAVGSTCDRRSELQKRSVDDPEAEFKVFEVGTATGCENRQYCNGALRPNTIYHVALRAYTTGHYSDTPFSGPIRTAPLSTTPNKTSVGGIIGGVVAALVAIVTVIVAILFMRRRMREKSNMYSQRPEQQLSSRAPVHQTRSSCPVALSDFKEHVRLMHADSDFRYAEQFENLKEIGRNQACTAAKLPCNCGKNRFTNILPYDHSRVKLLPIDDDEGSDYINANYIPGYTSKREYIVCQGPLPATGDDFWRLLWEQNSRNIVMLTRCQEKNREKCDHYWPSGSDAIFYGDLQVATLNETVFPDWVITEFKVSLGEQSRQIRHFHFTAWPDFGVPEQPPVLLRFVRTVRSKLFKDCGPTIVHCSAGVGRSGTFVVLDTLLQQMKTHSTVDIFGTVALLRRERVWMVQTEQQYICIHKCLLCVLERREDEHIYDNAGHSNIAFEADEGVVLN